ncbi:MAG: hypothetical protein ACYC7A_17355 [Thermoanaerobaculia bacterium]
MNCPACSATLPDGAIECSACGIILARWRPRGTTPHRTTRSGAAPARATQPGTAQRPVAAAAPPKPPLARRIALILVLSIVGASALVAAFWYVRIRPVTGRLADASPGREKKLKEVDPPGSNFDLAYEIDGSPLGAASNGRELIVGNRSGGVLRIRRDGSAYRAQRVPILESSFNQEVSISAIAWNGEHYVGYTTGSWFGTTGDVFTIHDPETLRIIDRRPAPPLIGCLAFDGSNYWGATRRNTEDSTEAAYLYRFDSELKVISTSAPPSVGCQGLVWDGRYLWLADVFADEVSVLDVSSGTPRVVGSHSVPVGYLSGIAVFEGEVWLTEYGEDRIARLRPSVRVAWGGGGPLAQVASVMAGRSPADAAVDVKALNAQLRSSDKFVRIDAEMRLNGANAPVLFDTDDNTVDRASDQAEVIDWSAEIRDDAVYASWRIWFGEDFFTERPDPEGFITIPKFARYTVTLIRPGADRKVEKVYDATPGENAMRDVLLGPATRSGDYSVEMFLHVQYVTADGTQRVINDSNIPLRLRR